MPRAWNNLRMNAAVTPLSSTHAQILVIEEDDSDCDVIPKSKQIC